MTTLHPKPILLMLILLALLGCRKKSISTDSGSAADADSIVLLFKSANDSLLLAWNRMIKDDDEKLFHIKRLLEEVSYTGKSDPLALDSLVRKHSALVQLRYDQKTMVDSDLIDAYDLQTSNLISEVTSFAKSNPDYSKYPLMEELIMDIMEADNRVLLHRIKYDNFCRDYNYLVDSRSAILTEAGETGLKKMPLFTLSE